MNKNTKWVGVDVGSTTVKIAILDPKTKKLEYSKYERHNAKQAETLLAMLKEAHDNYKESEFIVAVCGSGGNTLADVIGGHFIQEVVANAIAIREYFPKSRVAIELGGQDAKVIFFHHDDKTGQIITSDMRMNGSCAGGTGAFIDQIAELLDVKPQEFGRLAFEGKTVYDISGRCGVFAKTDIQPLLNQGVPKQDIALSSFHAIAKQTIGGLAQGAEILPPVIFEGGPLTFNPKLIEVFIERLGLNKADVIIPEKPEVIVASGAALSIGVMFADIESSYRREEALQKLSLYTGKKNGNDELAEQLFTSQKEYDEFKVRHTPKKFVPKSFKNGEVLNCYLGIDAGSTTSKFVLIDENEELIDKFYAGNSGEPLGVVQKALIKIKEKYDNLGVKLNILGAGTTGYGETLFAKAFKADFHTVETIAHAEAAMKCSKNLSFILDIGGQDMKAISIKEGIVTGIILNEACSAGCGSFIETYAKSLLIPVEKIAEMAFRSKSPSKLGSRCTVFMNSSIVTEQRNGKSTEDIMAGLCNSIIENVFTKIVRVSNFKTLGNEILAQGGTFKNDAVLRALEKYTGLNVIRPDHPGEMGAIGIALLTKKRIEEIKESGQKFTSTFIGFEKLKEFKYEKHPGSICKFCSNNCNRTVVKFNDGDSYVTGNRCEKGEIVGDIKDEKIKKRLIEVSNKKVDVPDLVKFRNEIFFKSYDVKEVSHKKNIKIGIPRILEFYNSYPYWYGFFTSLGFEVVLSDKSTYKIFEDGLRYIPSDTVCFPAKLAHGHIQNLISKKVDRIFMPMMMEIPPENEKIKESVNMCAIIQGYSLIIRENDEPDKNGGIIFDTPLFRWYNKKLRNKQTLKYMEEVFGLHKDVVLEAISEGDRLIEGVNRELIIEGTRVLKEIEEKNRFGVIIAQRPYHADDLINHNLSDHFVKQGIPVLTIDSLPDLHKVDLSSVRADTVNPFHTRLFAAALYTAAHPKLELVQLVSFGCGHDAINTDEMTRLAEEISKKQVLVLKLDEGEAQGPLNIRIKSFVETIKEKHKSIDSGKEEFTVNEASDPFKNKFAKGHKELKTILIPNLSESFSIIASKVLKRKGFIVETLPIADQRAKELGKIYVHNDICYPAQINIGEMLSVLEKGLYKPENTTLGLAKSCDACRAGQYAMLARKALDDAGYPEVSIITTGTDNKGMHPGFKLGLWFQIGMLVGINISDAMEEMRRKIRPYEVVKGETDRIYKKYLDILAETIGESYRKAFKVLETAIEEFNNIKIEKNEERPKVFVIGEILLNYHPTANENIERYLENKGLEVILPPFVDFFRRDVIRVKEGIKNFHIKSPVLNFFMSDLTDKLYALVLDRVEKRMKKFKFFEKKKNVHEMSELIDGMIDKVYMSGEGWLIPAEIIEHANKGVNSFIILQPFGCLPNHITGRGLTKAMKKRYPHIQILSLDYDPDTSFANIENRLQMLVMTAKEMHKK